MNNVINVIPYIKSSREFPPDPAQLSVILTRSYIEIAAAINLRTIGLFSINKAAITGESWYVEENQRQQSLRKVFTFTSTANIAHNIDFTTVSRFVRMFGCYTDGTNWYGIIAGTSNAIAGQLVFYVDPSNIVFVTGGGTMPALTKGNIVLEWLSNVPSATNV